MGLTNEYIDVVARYRETVKNVADSDHVLYVIYADEVKRCKIGYTRQDLLNSRFLNVRASSASEVELSLVYHEAKKDMRILEDRIHKNPWFRENHFRGEWYTLYPEEVEAMLLLDYGIRTVYSGIHMLFVDQRRQQRTAKLLEAEPILYDTPHGLAEQTEMW